MTRLRAVRLIEHAGRRWVRREIVGRSDPSLMMMEPRVRADLWLSPRLTVGGAVGAPPSDCEG
jgi:hypothetical protein